MTPKIPTPQGSLHHQSHLQPLTTRSRLHLSLPPSLLHGTWTAWTSSRPSCSPSPRRTLLWSPSSPPPPPDPAQTSVLTKTSHLETPQTQMAPLVPTPAVHPLRLQIQP